MSVSALHPQPVNLYLFSNHTFNFFDPALTTVLVWSVHPSYTLCGFQWGLLPCIVRKYCIYFWMWRKTVVKLENRLGSVKSNENKSVILFTKTLSAIHHKILRYWKRETQIYITNIHTRRHSLKLATKHKNIQLKHPTKHTRCWGSLNIDTKLHQTSESREHTKDVQSSQLYSLTP